jgi:hypothetical protein
MHACPRPGRNIFRVAGGMLVAFKTAVTIIQHVKVTPRGDATTMIRHSPGVRTFALIMLLLETTITPVSIF